MMFSIYFN